MTASTQRAWTQRRGPIAAPMSARPERDREHHALRAEGGDQVEAGGQRADDAPHGGPGVDRADGLAHLGRAVQGHLGHGRRDGAEAERGQHEDRQHREEDAHRPAQRLEGLLHGQQVVEPQRGEADRRGDEKQPAHEALGLPAVGEAAAEVVADAHPGEDHADDRGPGVERASQVARDEPPGDELDDHDAGGAEEDHHVRRVAPPAQRGRALRSCAGARRPRARSRSPRPPGRRCHRAGSAAALLVSVRISTSLDTFNLLDGPPRLPQRPSFAKHLGRGAALVDADLLCQHSAARRSACAR